MRYFLLVVCSTWTMFSAHAQSGTISGKITDSTGKKALQLTTITVYKAADTALLAYRLSTESGEFRVPGLPLNTRLRLIATYSGFLPYRMELELTAANPTVPIGTLKLKPTTSTLDEVIVTAERPPVIYKNDTIEFNASAFKTLPTALVEDLLKKMPGIDIDEAGNITMNGRRVNRILVDGKRFFGDDPRMATRNLPSNLIDKVQVVDDQEQIALNNDGNMSTIGKVINLTLKKEIKKAVFGKLSAGIGTDSRYEASGIINSFRDTLQISLIGFRNNINRSSFTLGDVTSLGGFGRSNLNSISLYSGQGREGFAVNGISFGGTTPGISLVNGAGLNLNHSPSKKFSFYTQYFYGQNSSTIVQEQNTKRFVQDTIYNILAVSNALNNGFSHTLGTGTNWKADSLTNITASVEYVFTDNSSLSPVSIISQNTKLGILSTTNGLLNNGGQNRTYNHNLTITRRFSAKKGRSISISHNLSNNVNPSSITTENTNTFYIPATQTFVFQQLRTIGAPSTSFTFAANYSDPLSAALTLRINERLNYNKYGRDMATFGISSGGKLYDSMISALTNGLSREQIRWSNGVSLSYRIKKVTIGFTPTYLLQWIGNNFTHAGSINTKQQYHNLLFNANLAAPLFSIGFSQDLTPPQIFYLNPVPDNSNPIFLSLGNPDLLPTKRSQLDFFFNMGKPKFNLSYFISASSAFLNNYILHSVTLNSSGIQTTRPVNVNGVVNNSLNFRVTKQYKNSKKITATLELNGNGVLNKLPVVYNGIQSGSTVIGGGLNTRILLNWHDVVEFNTRYNPSLMNTKYESKLFNSVEVVTQVLSGELIVRLPKKIIWETNATFRSLSNVPVNFPKTNLNWNAAITMLFLKQDKGQLRLAVYDILNTNNNVLNIINGNSVVDTRSNVLKRYGMLTFSYNIRSINKDKIKIGGRQNMFLF